MSEPSFARTGRTPRAPAPPDPIPAQIRLASDLEEYLREDDDALLRGKPAVRVGIVARRSISFGVGTSASAAFLPRARSRGVLTIRRSTGGSGVLHEPGDLLWSVVLPRSHPAVGPDFVRAYDRLGRGPVRWLASGGLSTLWGDPERISEDLCFLSGRGRVLRAEGRVLGGAAQHLTGTALLHQGAVSWHVDHRAVAELFGVAPVGGADRLVGLDELGFRGTAEPIVGALARALSTAFDERS